MKRTEKYESPEVTVFELSMSECILQESVRGNVRTEGQDYEELTYGSGNWSYGDWN